MLSLLVFGHGGEIIEGALVNMDHYVRAQHDACINLFSDVVRGKYQTRTANGKSLRRIHESCIDIFWIYPLPSTMQDVSNKGFYI